jgi:putative membrane protein
VSNLSEDRGAESQGTLRDALAVERTVLANERTVLAYLRTGIALLIGGLGCIGFFENIVMRVLGGALVLLALVAVITGFRKYIKTKRVLATLNKIDTL